MKKILFLLLAISIQAFAQDPDFSESFTGEASSYSPVSPEAGTLGKYGNISFSRYNGHMSFSIPLHSIDAAGYSWPVSLGYSYGGLILEAKPSMAGLGWSLNASGVVTRQVRGLPDEHPDGYYGINNRKAMVEQYMQQGIDNFTLDEMKNMSSGKWDTKADNYTVSVGDLHFSFKLDASGNPVYLSQHNNTVSYSDSSIEVTDSRGIVYVFSDIEINRPPYSELFNIESGTDHYTTSWLLSQIIFPNNEPGFAPTNVINFSYIDDTYDEVSWWAKGNNRKFYGVTVPDIEGNFTLYNQGFYVDGHSDMTIDRKLLSGISFPGGQIDLNIVTHQGRKLYNKITVKDHNLQTITEYDLTHQHSRDVLTQVDKNGQLYYGFDYYFADLLPSFFLDDQDKPLAQDRWKFFNGAANAHFLSIPNSSYDADKEPDFSKTRYGAMRKIHYPTGGYSEIHYEQNTIKSLYTTGSIANNELAFNRQILLSLQADGNLGAPAVKTSSFTYTFDQPVVADISSRITGTRGGTHLLLTINRLSGICSTVEGAGPFNYSDYYNDAPAIRALTGTSIPEMCPALSDEFGPDDGDPSDYIDQIKNSGGRIVISPGTYLFEISNDYNQFSDAYGEIKLRFHQPEATVGDYYIDEPVGGIRVARIEHKDSDEAITATRYFEYSEEDDFSSGRLISKEVKTVDFEMESLWTDGSYTKYIREYRYNRYSSMEASQGAPVYYTRVKQYNDRYLEELPPLGPQDPVYGDTNPDGSSIFSNTGPALTSNFIKHYPQGYTLTEFTVPVQNFEFSYPQIPVSKDLSKGRVAVEEVYEQHGDSLRLISQKNNQYKWFKDLIDADGNDLNPLHPWSLEIAISQDMYWDCRFGMCDQFPNPAWDSAINSTKYIVKPYKEIHSRFKPEFIETNTLTYIDGVLQQATDQVDMLYDGYYQLKQQSTTNSNGDTLTKVFDYPYDDPALYQDLIDAQQISKITGSRIFKNGEKLAEKTIDYIAVGGDYKPSQVHIAKENNIPQPGISYLYDDKGNVIRVTYPGNQTALPQQQELFTQLYVWGYDQRYPIAKIEGMGLTAVDAVTLQNLQSLSDNDIDAVSEQSLRNALQLLRESYPEASVTTYTYDPMKGLTSSSDPRGYISFYIYDELQRLQSVKDTDGNILEAFYYNYAQEPIQYDPLVATVDYGTDDTDHQWFSANASGGSGDYSYAWFEGIGDSSTEFEVNVSGTNDTYQLIVDCNATKYVKLIVTDNITGQTTEKTKVNNNSCNYAPLNVSIGYGTHSDNFQNFTSSVSGGSGNYSYSWHKGIGTSSFNFEVNATSVLPNCAVSVSCTTYKWVKLVITDTVTGETAYTIKKSNNSPCSGGGGPMPDPTDPQQ